MDPEPTGLVDEALHLCPRLFGHADHADAGAVDKSIISRRLSPATAI